MQHSSTMRKVPKLCLNKVLLHPWEEGEQKAGFKSKLKRFVTLNIPSSQEKTSEPFIASLQFWVRSCGDPCYPFWNTVSNTIDYSSDALKISWAFFDKELCSLAESDIMFNGSMAGDVFPSTNSKGGKTVESRNHQLPAKLMGDNYSTHSLFLIMVITPRQDNTSPRVVMKFLQNIHIKLRDTPVPLVQQHSSKQNFISMQLTNHWTTYTFSFSQGLGTHRK